MPIPQVEFEALNIVLLGTFNPKIFSPFWFSSENLISKQEAEKATVGLVHPHATTFSTSWFELSVTPDRLQIGTIQKSHFELVRDLIVGTFQLLRHTPIHTMGINWDFHYRMSNTEEWHRFGDKLAPKDCWKSVLKEPGLTSLSIRGNRSDGKIGQIIVRVEPSKRIGDKGVFIEVNDQYEVTNKKEVQGCNEIIENLRTVWNDSQEKASEVINAIWS